MHSFKHGLVILPIVAGLAGCETPSRVETLSIDGAVSSLVVKSGAGDVDLLPSEDSAVSVEVTLTGKGTKFSYEVKDGELTLKKKCGFLNVGVCETDFTIYAPSNISATVETSSGSIEVSDWGGPLDLSTGSGEVGVTVCSGNLLIDTGSGPVTAKEISSNHVGIFGGSGEIELDVVEEDFEDILVDSGSGDVMLYLPGNGAYDLTAEAGSGQVFLSGVVVSSNASAVVEVYTGSGDITIQGQ